MGRTDPCLKHDYNILQYIGGYRGHIGMMEEMETTIMVLCIAKSSDDHQGPQIAAGPMKIPKPGAPNSKRSEA